MFVGSELRGLTTIDGLFEVMSHLDGEVYREVASRRTFRFEHGGKAYFAKVHFGVGWKEIIKNYLQLRAPVVDASNELRAIHRLQAMDIETLTPVAYSCEGVNPASRKSCIVTEALQNTVSLEDLAGLGPLEPVFKRALIRRVAEICRTMHSNGVNHRDLYICHFHLDLDQLSPPRLFVIDLHRAQTRQATPRRWLIKDLAGLLFSTRPVNLSSRDLLRFIRIYSGMPLRQALESNGSFWRKVVARANNLNDREQHKEGVL